VGSWPATCGGERVDRILDVQPPSLSHKCSWTSLGTLPSFETHVNLCAMSIRPKRLIGKVGWQRAPLSHHPFGLVFATNANGVRVTMDDGKNQFRMDRPESYNGYLSKSRVGDALGRPPCKMAIGVASRGEGGGHMHCPQMELHCLVVSTWNQEAQRRPCHHTLANIAQFLWNQRMVAKGYGG